MKTKRTLIATILLMWCCSALANTTSLPGQITKLRIHDSVTFSTTQTVALLVAGFSNTPGCAQLNGLNEIVIRKTDQSNELFSTLLAIKMANKDVVVNVDTNCLLRYIDLN